MRPPPRRPGGAGPPDSPTAGHGRGRHYHEVLKECLARLGEVRGKAAPGARSGAVVQTGGALEKLWGVEAGRGWQENPTPLSAPRAGSWFFLGELVSDLE